MSDLIERANRKYGVEFLHGGVANFDVRIKHPIVADLLAELARLTDEVERLRADAGRYRWLREREYMDIAGCWLLPDGFLDPASPVAVDAAIDAAIKEAGNG